ncbi:MAG TPA: hydantoinase B/oxoprolinase family protein, partial [Dehalococcoidia bacterium]|nr:hydantoinase B/oxoprolinase family protein [Dehalococcoidia bacterium]
MKADIDPITFEVLRHRLWAINDEAGATIKRISGSPVATEAYDFNTGILTAQGDMLVIGIYITTHASVQDIIIRNILQDYAENPGIGEDDMFITNDPYYGALHQPDVTCVAPVHWKGELVAWCGCTVHQIDVGGPVPGSFTVGARSIYEEAPPIPPLKIVEGGVLRRDLEREYLRRSRTAPLVALDLRAQIAANNVAKARIQELIKSYGLDTVKAVMTRMIDYVEVRFRARLRELPDGTWRHVSFVEHDGLEDKVYPCRLTAIKSAENLTLDFTESAPQAPALINGCYSGLRGGIMSSLLPMLCYDMPWSPAGLWRAIDLRTRKGTIVDAEWPAGVSMSSISACWAARITVNVCLGKMLAASEALRDHAMASWQGAWPGQNLAGINQRGEPFGTMILDAMAGGSGARTWKDGVDSGGIISSLGSAAANVETNEYFYPLLYLYRRQVPDSGGPGKYRGGVSASHAFAPYRTPSPLVSALFSHGVEQPPSSGIGGGYPGSTADYAMVRDSNLWELFKSGLMPQELKDLAGKPELIPPKAVTQIGTADVFRCVYPGGGGYGDPLDRGAELVLADLRSGLVSREVARGIYGIVVDASGQLDPEGTDERRTQIRRDRQAEARGESQPALALASANSRSLSESLEIVEVDGKGYIRCCRCGTVISPARENYKLSAPMGEYPLDRGGPQIAPHRDDGRFVLREFYCPGCWTLLEVETNMKGEPAIWDI